MATNPAAAVKLVEEKIADRRPALKVNERAKLGDFRPMDHAHSICLLAETMDRCGLVLEVEKATAFGAVTLYAARRTRRATTVTV